ncbi:hypothetical protein D3C84_804540 [compost metagenome]
MLFAQRALLIAEPEIANCGIDRIMASRATPSGAWFRYAGRLIQQRFAQRIQWVVVQTHSLSALSQILQLTPQLANAIVPKVDVSAPGQFPTRG